MMPLYDLGKADADAFLTKLAAPNKLISQGIMNELKGAFGQTARKAAPVAQATEGGLSPELLAKMRGGISLGRPARDPARMAKIQKYMQYRGARGEIAQITPQMYGKMQPQMREHYTNMARPHPKLNQRMFNIADQSARPQIGGVKMTAGANPLARAPAPAQPFASLNDELSAFGKGASFSGDTDMQKTAYDFGVEQAMAEYGLVKTANGFPPGGMEEAPPEGAVPVLGDEELEQLVAQMSPEELEQLLNETSQEDLGQVGAGMDPQNLEAMLSQLSPEELHQLMMELEGQGGGAPQGQGGGMPPGMEGGGMEEGGEAPPEGGEGEGGGNPFAGGGGKSPKKEKKEEKGEKKEKKEDAGEEKEAAFKLANPMLGLLGKLKAMGGQGMGRSMLGMGAAGGAGGALVGGAAGAVGADSGHRGEGFARGALAGGAAGAAGGAMIGRAGNLGQRLRSASGAHPGLAGRMGGGNAGGRFGNMALGGAGVAAAGAPLAGYAAGTGAQQSPMEKLKARLSGLMG